MLVMKDRSTHDRQLLHASPLVAAFAKAMIEYDVFDVLVNVFTVLHGQCISTPI